LFHYYVSHSLFSDPGKDKKLLSVFSDQIEMIPKQIHQLLLHETDAPYYKIKIDSIRYAELNARYLDQILFYIKQYNSKPLNTSRPPKERVLSVCRDSALFFCAVLRSRNIPARLRSGFLSYLIPGLYLGACFAEYFDEKINDWKMIDPRTTEDFIQQYHLKIDFDLMKLPQDKFISAAFAWQAYRAGKIDAARFGVRKLRGFKILRNHLIQDLALLNKQETLVWDLWGLMLDSPDQHLDVLDALSHLLLTETNNLDRIQQFYHQYDFLTVPNEVLVDHPYLTAEKIRLRTLKNMHEITLPVSISVLT